MRSKFTTLIAAVGLLAVSTGVLADEGYLSRKEAANDRAAVVEPNRLRPEVLSSAAEGTGEQVAPRLDAVILQIDEQFGARMDAIVSRISAATSSEEINALELQAMNLKTEWWLATANRKLEMARLDQNPELEAEILNSIDHVVNPQAPKATPIEEENHRREGGAQ